MSDLLRHVSAQRLNFLLAFQQFKVIHGLYEVDLRMLIVSPCRLDIVLVRLQLCLSSLLKFDFMQGVLLHVCVADVVLHSRQHNHGCHQRCCCTCGRHVQCHTGIKALTAVTVFCVGLHVTQNRPSKHLIFHMHTHIT